MAGIYSMTMKKKLLGEADLSLAMATEKTANAEKAAKEAD